MNSRDNNLDATRSDDRRNRVSSRSKQQIIPRAMPINKPANDKSLERRSNSIKKQSLPKGVRIEIGQMSSVQQLDHAKSSLSIRESELPDDKFIRVPAMDNEKQSLSKSTIKNPGSVMPSRQYIQRLDQVVDEMNNLEMQNQRIQAENAALKEELLKLRTNKSGRSNENQQIVRKLRQAEDSIRVYKECLNSRDLEIQDLQQKASAYDSLEQSYTIIHRVMIDVSKLFGSENMGIEQLKLKIQSQMRESQQLYIQIQQLESALRERQFIGNEQLQSVIQKYNETVFQKNELELKLFDAKEEITTLNNTIEQMNTRLTNLAEQVAMKNKDQMVFRMESQDLRAELEIYRKQCSAYKQRINVLLQEKETLHRDRLNVEKEANDKLRLVSDMRSSAIIEAESRLSQQLVVVAAQRDRFKRQSQENREELIRTNIQREHLAVNVAKLQATLEDLNSQKIEWIRSTQKLQTSLRESSSHFNQLQTEQRLKLEMSLGQSQQQIMQYSRYNNDLNVQISQMSQRNSDLQRQIEEIRRDQGEKMIMVDKLKFQNNQLAMNLEEAHRQVRNRESQLESAVKALHYQIDSIDRARKLAQEEYDRQRNERMDVQSKLRQSQYSLFEATSKVFNIDKQNIEITRLSDMLKSQSDIKHRIQQMLEQSQQQLKMIKDQFHRRELDFEKDKNMLTNQLTLLHTEIDSANNKCNRISTEYDLKLRQSQQKINNLIFELQSSKNELLNFSNNREAEIHKMHLAMEHTYAQQNSLRITIDRQVQQMKQTEDELQTTKSELQQREQRHRSEVQQLRNEIQFLTTHYESLIKQIKQSSSEQQSVRIKTEIAQKLTIQYEHRIDLLKAQMEQQEGLKVRQTAEKYQKQVQSYKQQIEEFRKQIDSYQRQVQDMGRKSNDDQSWQILQLQQRFKEVNEALNNTQKFYQARIDQLEKQISKKSKQYELRIEELKKEEANKQRIIDRMREQTEMTRDDSFSRRHYRQYEDSANMIKVTLEQKLGQISMDFQGKSQYYEQRIRQLERMKSELEDRIHKITLESQSKMLHFDSTTRQLSEELKYKQEQLQYFRMKEGQYDHGTTELQNKLHRIEKRANELDSQLNEQKKSSTLYRQTQSEMEKKTNQMIESLRKEMAQAHAQANEQRYRNLYLQGEVQRLKMEQKQLSETRESTESRKKFEHQTYKLQEKNRIIVEQREEIQNLLVRHDKLRLQLSARDDKHYQQLRALKDTSFAFQKQNIELRSKLQMLEIKMEELKMQLKDRSQKVQHRFERFVSPETKYINAESKVLDKVSPVFVSPEPKQLKQDLQSVKTSQTMASNVSRRIIADPQSVNYLSPKNTMPVKNTQTQSAQVINRHLSPVQNMQHNPVFSQEKMSYFKPAMTIENVVKIETIRGDSMERQRQMTIKPDDIRNESPPGRKITITDGRKPAINVKRQSIPGAVEIINRTMSPTQQTILTIEQRNRSGSREKPRVIHIGQKPLTKETTNCSSPNLIVNKPVVHTVPVEQYQIRPATIKHDRKMTQIKRVQSNNINVKMQPEEEEQGIQVFQAAQLDRPSCC